ncbi:MAG: DUF2147 domain-containing protein [Alphaproteobacteria bacterium]|jgi:uncharacterized protein (DUF2147 family)|nr:DUF2147 domain-containing protein [Alphaproteobacteria bacterium]
MSPGLIVAASLALAGLPLLNPAPAPAGDPVGVWVTADGSSEVRIAPCGADICGFPSDAPDPPAGTNLAVAPTPHDPRNQILWLEHDPDGRWKGWVYSPRSGKVYRALLEMRAANRLKLTGCLVGPLCHSQIWSRAS